jgi:hypothetical protein
MGAWHYQVVQLRRAINDKKTPPSLRTYRDIRSNLWDQEPSA